MAVASLIALACQKENTVALPGGYSGLYEDYSRNRVFCSAGISGNVCTVNYADGGSRSIDIREFGIEDCRKASAKTVSVNGHNEWIVGGAGTGIERDVSLSDKEAAPVYAYFTYETLTVFLRNGSRLSFLSTNVIPVIRLTTKNNAKIESKEVYVDGTMTVEDKSGLYPGMDGFTATMKIRGRGNSTWGLPKKPWKVKLDGKATMFGMSTDKEWCLLANYTDKSLMRNNVAMEISRILGFAWTPRMIDVEVYLNGEYQGVYNFAEHKKVSSERVNVDLDDGDMYFEIEELQDNEVCWKTDIYQVPMMFSDPEVPDASAERKAKDYFNDFETALSGDRFADAEEGYAAYIDVDSFIDYYIIQELVKNVDGDLRKSTFLTLPASGKLEMYHVWDFDITLGNCDYFDTVIGGGMDNGFSGWYIARFSSMGADTGWYWRMFRDPAFKRKAMDRWKAVYPVLKEEIPEYIEKKYIALAEPAKRNFRTWDILSSYVWPNVRITGSYRAEIDYLLEFYNHRLEWINTNLQYL